MKFWSGTNDPLWGGVQVRESAAFAFADGGATAQASTGELFGINPAGQAEATVPVVLADPIQFGGGWIGNGTTTAVLRAVVAEGLASGTTYDATRVPVGGGLYEQRGSGAPSGQSAPRKMCGLCVKDYLPPSGHGPASSTDNRRVINVVIDSSWEEQPEELNPRIPQKNTTTTTIRDEDLAGRLAHEFAHKFGAWSKRPCDLIKPPTVTILDGSNYGPGWVGSPKFGQRSINQVTAFDVELVNQALMAPSTCTATPATPASEPMRPE